MAVDMVARMMAMGNGGGTSDAYTKAETDSLLDGKVDKATGKGLSTNDYTTEEKDKLAGVASGAEANVQSDWSQSDSSADDYIKNKPAIPTVNDATLTIQKNGTAVGTFSANAATAATINITVPVDAEDVDALPDTTKYGASLSLSIDSATYVVTASLKDQDGNTLGTPQTIDLPLETVVVGGSYDETTKKVVLMLKNGTTVDFSVADLVSGLQTEITSTNKLGADLVDDTTSVHKFVTAADKSAWNAKSDFSGSYNDLTNKPTIPAAQVNADWNATSGVAKILNKPTLGSAAFENYTTSITYGGTGLPTSGTVYTDQKRQDTVIGSLVDRGAKNLLHVDNVHVFSANGVTFTANPDGTISTSGTAGNGGTYCSLTLGGTFEANQVYIERFCDGNHMLAGCPSGGNYSSGYSMYAATGLYNRVDEGNGVLLTPTETTYIRIVIMIRQGTNADGLVFKPMICTAEDWAVSHKFVPYAPSNRELYEMILALQNGGNG